MSYLDVKWNSGGADRLPMIRPSEHGLSCAGHSRSEDPELPVIRGLVRRYCIPTTSGLPVIPGQGRESPFTL
jgi:hypothetical protein